MVKLNNKSRGRPCNPIRSVLKHFSSPKMHFSRSLNQKLTNSFYHNFYNSLKSNLSSESYVIYSSELWPKNFLSKDEREVYQNKENSYFKVAISQNLRLIYKSEYNTMIDKYAHNIIDNYDENLLEKIFNCKLNPVFKEPIRQKFWKCLVIDHLAQIGKERFEIERNINNIIDLIEESEIFLENESKVEELTNVTENSTESNEEYYLESPLLF